MQTVFMPRCNARHWRVAVDISCQSSIDGGDTSKQLTEVIESALHGVIVIGLHCIPTATYLDVRYT